MDFQQLQEQATKSLNEGKSVIFEFNLINCETKKCVRSAYAHGKSKQEATELFFVKYPQWKELLKHHYIEGNEFMPS